MRQSVWVLVGSLALALGPADAPARAQAPAALELRAFSDAHTLPAPNDPPPVQLRQGAHPHCPPPAPAGGAPTLSLEYLERTIASAEESLRAMPANDPRRAGFEASLERLKEARDRVRAGQPAVPAAPAAPTPAVPAKPPTFKGALAEVRKALEAQAGRAALAALAASPEGKDPARASLAAVAAVAANNPGGALAALLAAHARAPKDPAHLSNAAAVLNALGRPAEALAFLDQAARLGEPAAALGMRGRAVLLSNRGHALLGLKRFADAERVLAQAVALEPRLSEAGANLAAAQLCGGKSKEAVRSFAASVWRTPAKQLVCLDPPGAGSDPKVCAGRARKSATEAFDLSAGAGSSGGRDLSAGKPGSLPPLPYPETLEGAKRLAPFYESLERRNAERTLAYHRVRGELERKISERERRANAGKPARKPSRLTQQRFHDLKIAIYSAPLEPSARPFHARLEALGGQLDATFTAIERALYRRTCEEKLKLYRESHRTWLPLMQAYDKAVRARFAEVHRIKSGLAANLSDPLHHQWAVNTVEHHAWSSYYNLSAKAGRRIKWVAHHAPECLEPDSSAAPAEPGEVEIAKVPSCPAFVRGAKFTVKLGVVSLQVNCEQVEVEGSGPSWLSGFASVGYKFAPPGTVSQSGRRFDGQLTVAVGVKATAGRAAFAPPTKNLSSPLAPIEVSAKGGVYATFNGDGDVVDLGLVGEVLGAAGEKLGVELGGDAGGIGGPVSLASSIATP